MPVQAPPYRFEGARLPIRHVPPTLGQHTREVLLGLGYSSTEVDAMIEQGIARAP